VRVGFVQTNPKFGDVEGNIERALSLMQGRGADIFVLPELFNSGYLFTSRGELEEVAEEIPRGATAQALLKFCQQMGLFLVAGLAERFRGRVFNSAILVGPSGVEGVYRKVHLFAEEKRWFSPGGEGFSVYEIRGVKIGIMICFDWIFPEAARILALKGAEIICHPANLILPWCQRAMVTRSIENRVFIVTANRIGREKREQMELRFTGGSQITTPQGELLLQASLDKEEVGITDVDTLRARDKAITQENDLFSDRRPDLYLQLVRR
jgi:predicted amidohydrolase